MEQTGKPAYSRMLSGFAAPGPNARSLEPVETASPGYAFGRATAVF